MQKTKQVLHRLVVGLLTAIMLLGTVAQLFPAHAAEPTDEQTQSATLSYVVDATINFVDGDQTNTIKTAVGKPMAEPAHEEKTGYEFMGWQDEKTGDFWDFSKEVTENMALVARYQKIPSDTDNAPATKVDTASIQPRETSGANTGVDENAKVIKALCVVSIVGICEVALFKKDKKDE